MTVRELCEVIATGPYEHITFSLTWNDSTVKYNHKDDVQVAAYGNFKVKSLSGVSMKEDVDSELLDYEIQIATTPVLEVAR